MASISWCNILILGQIKSGSWCQSVFRQLLSVILQYEVETISFTSDGSENHKTSSKNYKSSMYSSTASDEIASAVFSVLNLIILINKQSFQHIFSGFCSLSDFEQTRIHTDTYTLSLCTYTIAVKSAWSALASALTWHAPLPAGVMPFLEPHTVLPPHQAVERGTSFHFWPLTSIEAAKQSHPTNTPTLFYKNVCCSLSRETTLKGIQQYSYKPLSWVWSG